MTNSLEKLAASMHLAAVLARFQPRMASSQTTPWVVALDAARIVQIGRAFTRLGVEGCNIGLTERDTKRRYSLEQEANDIAARYGLAAEASGDPRGYVLRLHGPGLPRNNMGEGFEVA